MKNYLIFFTCLFFVFTSNAQTIFWTGNSSQNWEDPDNWDTNTIPGSDDEVVIDITSGPVIYDMPSSTIKSLSLRGTAQLIIERQATLEVYKSTFRGISINSNASLINNGTLLFSSIPLEGIFVEGTLVNEKKGFMEFKEVGQRAIYVLSGNFSNHGYVLLLKANVGQGITVATNSSMTNTGGIEIEKGYPGNFQIYSNSEVTNSGIMDFSIIHDMPFRILINSTFFNLSNATLQIERFSSGASTMFISLGSVFENAGLIHLQNESRNLNPITGILLVGTSFDNLNNGIINVQGFATGILVEPNQKFNNIGQINIIDGGDTGILNRGNFNNRGALSLTGLTRFRNEATGGLINDGGVITEEGISFTFIQNQGSIVNKVCSDIIGKSRFLLTSAGIIKNYGYLACIEDGAQFGNIDHILNYGIINDPFDRFRNAIDNQGIYIGSLDNLIGDFIFLSALDIANSNDFEIDDDWYSQTPFNNTNYIGYYDLSLNELQLEDDYSTNPLPYYYTTITHLPRGCDKIVKIRIDPAVLPPSAAALPPGSGIIDTPEVRTHSSSPLELSVFPNPSAGNFMIQFPENSKGELDVRVIDLQGRVVAEYQSTEQAALPIDLEGQLPSGMYLLQVSQQGAVIGTERVMVEGGTRKYTPSARF